jgi:CRISPR/Cas system-associated endoribonuclease Cas2
MKRVLLIFYDLADPGQNREALVKKIKTRTWARLGDSAYLIVTDEPPTVVRNDLTKVLTSNDRIFVGTASAPSAWRGLPEDVSKWIVEHQTSS